MQAQILRPTFPRRRVPTLPPELCAISMTVATTSVTALRQAASIFAGETLQFVRIERSDTPHRSMVVVCVFKTVAEQLVTHLVEAFPDIELGRRREVILHTRRDPE